MGKRSSIVHIEWRSRNVAKLKEFYRAAFAWKFDESMPGYLLADSGDKGLAIGMLQIENGSALSPGIVPFLESHDLAQSESVIREAGGQIIGEPQEVPGWGRFSVFTDPDGTPVGLWQSHDSVKKEEKRQNKAEKKRARASETATAPAEESASDKAARKAAKAARKLEKKSHKQSEKAKRKADEKMPKKAKKAVKDESSI